MTGRLEVATRVRREVVRVLRVPMREVSDNAEYRADLKADSLNMMSLAMALEEEFGIAISDDEADFCETVGTTIDIISGKLERARGGRHAE